MLAMSLSAHELEGTLEVVNWRITRTLAEDGRHFVLNTQEVFAEDVRDGTVVALPIREKAAVWRFGLKRRRDAFETPAMRLFAEFMRQAVREQHATKRSSFHNQ
jgi:hypothetical protein